MADVQGGAPSGAPRLPDGFRFQLDTTLLLSLPPDMAQSVWAAGLAVIQAYDDTLDPVPFGLTCAIAALREQMGVRDA